MKKIITTALACVALCTAITAVAQQTPNISDTAKHPPIASPRDSIVGTTKTGVTITMTYGSPAIKGRTIGKNLDPYDDTLWRAGANEATTFAVNKEVSIEGKKLPAGRYALFAIKHGNEWTFIFNKAWSTWGAYSYKQNKAQDVLQVKVTQATGGNYYNERLKYVIDSQGIVYLFWGNIVTSFTVK
ncbi:MAG: DUF2911 domain-containing protein [Bacteroidota bacterium]|nr:DUF2911 domain-containing protein [Bacteroidota bacterium]